MTWLDQHEVVAGVIGLAGGVAGGVLVPRIIARIPEPGPEAEEQLRAETDPASSEEDAAVETAASEPEPPKELYVDIAGRPRLGIGAAAVGAMAGGAIGVAIGMSWSLVLLLPLVPIGIALAVVDARTRLLPTKLVVPATGAAIVVAAVIAAVQSDWDALARAAIALLVLRSIFWVLWWIHSAGMGFGDVRLSALLGWVLGYLGWAEVIVSFYVGFLSFVIPGVLLALVRRDRKFLKMRIPFGPFLLFGALAGIVAGPWLLESLGY